MKRLFTFIAIAALATACCNKQPAVLSVEKFFENPGALINADTTITGTVQEVCPFTGLFLIGTADNTQQQMLVQPVFEMKPCKGIIGKEIIVKGVIKEQIVNEETLAAWEEEAEAIECPKTKEGWLQMIAEFKEKVAATGEYTCYYIEATDIKCAGCEGKGCKEKKEGCCKDGEKKEGCCKDKKEGCCKDGEKKEGCCKDGEKKEGCCKDGEKKEGCCKDKKEGCEKKATE